MNSLKSGFILSLVPAILIVICPVRGWSHEIQFSNQVPQNEVDLLNDDLTGPLDFADDIPAFKELMDVKDLAYETLKAWLGERVNFIVAESEDPSDELSVLQENYAYQNPDLFPDIETGDVLKKKYQDGLTPQRVGTIMTNVGTNFYLHGKKTKTLLGYAFQGARAAIPIKVTTPRVGIIQIGQGLFLRKMNDDVDNALSNSIYRMSILFHEAHHSDGNGKSLGFVHALCPKDSPYYNTPSCDREANGPYTVEAYFIRHAVIACHAEKKCDDDEAERLSFVGTDALDRVISDQILDPAPEGL